MAKSVIFTDLATPTGLTGSLVSGGTLAANTTYYYKVIAVFNNGTYAATFDGKSLASNEFSITTTTTQKSVTLTFNHPKGTAGGYRVYRAISTGAYSVCLNIALLDSTYNVAGLVTWTDDGSVPYSANNAFQNTSHGKLLLASTSPTTDI
jgi:hypothetical protein